MFGIINTLFAEEERVCTQQDNIKFKPYSDVNEVIDDFFELLHSKYQVNLETTIRGSDFIFDSVQLMYCKCHRGNFICDNSYIDSPGWIKKDKKQL